MGFNRRALLTGQFSNNRIKATIRSSAISNRHVLVCLFQRGAADALNAIVPYSDSNYFSHRPTIAIPPPGEFNGALDLDGFFGMNPNLTGFHSLYQQGHLAVVNACGIPHGSRSHFDAQVLVERAASSKAGDTSGWLGRHFAMQHQITPPNSSFHLVALSGNVPVSLYGAEEPLAMANIAEFGLDQGIIDSGYTDVLDKLFKPELPLHDTAQTALNALDELQIANPSQFSIDNNATYPNSELGNKMRQVAQLIKSDLPVETVCVDSENWDHHESIATYLPQSLSDLDNAVSAFYQDMGSRMDQVTVLIHTEFGRRVKENASAGVDHGTGSVAYLLGNGINGGQVIGAWPGLAQSNLEQGEDLAITTDLRSVFAEVLTKRMGATDLTEVLPGFEGSLDLGALI